MVLAAGLAGPTGAGATTYTPTRFDDPTPGHCKPGDCSLREALVASNAHGGSDRISLSKGRYELEIPPSGDDTGSFDLRDEMILAGKGAGATKIDGNNLDSTLLVGPDNELGDSFAIKDLTVTGGLAGSFGGGVDAVSFENDKLVLKRVSIMGNQANFGGGLYADIKRLTISHSTIGGNQGTTHGGGLRLGSSSTSASAKATIKKSTITGNGAQFGGGIYNFFPDLTLSDTTIDNNNASEGGGMDIVGQIAAPHTTIRSSTLSRNSAVKGGGILADGNQPSVSFAEPIVEVQNSTVALNEASGEGGGVMADNSATVSLDNVTVAYNTADVDNTGGGVGGGVRQHSAATLGVGDSIVAANSVGSSGSGPQCDGALSEGDGLIYQSQPSGTCSFSGQYTIIADPLILPLAPQGGATESVKLLSGSPALGFAKSCPQRDQRGVKRPPLGCDSGAFERKRP